MYSLPIGLAKIFRNCGYLEYPAMGRFPDPPANGYVSSGADLGDLCCPCWCGTADNSGDEDEEVAVTKAPADAKEKSDDSEENAEQEA